MKPMQGSFASKRAHECSCEILLKSEIPNVVEQVVVSDGLQNVYCGKHDESPLVNNFIVIRNRRMNSIRLYPSENFLVSPYRRKVVLENPEQSILATKHSSELRATFGSKKSKRGITAQASKYDVSVGDFETYVKDVIKNEPNETVLSPGVSSCSMNQDYLPPCHRDAANVIEVYRLEELVSDEILDQLEKVTQRVLNEENIPLDLNFTTFFRDALPHFGRNPFKVKLLIFVDNLLQFLLLTSWQLRRKNPLICPYSPALKEYILKEFCTVGLNGARMRDSKTRDKCLCYILVILLIIGDYKIDYSLLSNLIKPMEYNRLPKLLNAIGARKGKEPTSFYLKLPLPEQLQNHRRRKSVH